MDIHDKSPPRADESAQILVNVGQATAVDQEAADNVMVETEVATEALANFPKELPAEMPKRSWTQCLSSVICCPFTSLGNLCCGPAPVDFDLDDVPAIGQPPVGTEGTSEAPVATVSTGSAEHEVVTKIFHDTTSDNSGSCGQSICNGLGCVFNAVWYVASSIVSPIINLISCLANSCFNLFDDTHEDDVLPVIHDLTDLDEEALKEGMRKSIADQPETDETSPIGGTPTQVADVGPVKPVEVLRVPQGPGEITIQGAGNCAYLAILAGMIKLYPDRLKEFKNLNKQVIDGKITPPDFLSEIKPSDFNGSDLSTPKHVRLLAPLVLEMRRIVQRDINNLLDKLDAESMERITRYICSEKPAEEKGLTAKDYARAELIKCLIDQIDEHNDELRRKIAECDKIVQTNYVRLHAIIDHMYIEGKMPINDFGQPYDSRQRDGLESGMLKNRQALLSYEKELLLFDKPTFDESYLTQFKKYTALITNEDKLHYAGYPELWVMARQHNIVIQVRRTDGGETITFNGGKSTTGEKPIVLLYDQKRNHFDLWYPGDEDYQAS